MDQWIANGVTQDGRKVRVEVEAGDAAQAERRAARRGLTTVVHVERKPTPAGGNTYVGVQSPVSDAIQQDQHYGAKRSNKMGMVSLIIGLVVLLPAFIPGCGLVVVVPLAIIGGIFGIVGLIAAISDSRTGVALPLAGIGANLLAVVIGVVMLTFLAGTAASVAQEAERQRAEREAATQPAP